MRVCAPKEKIRRKTIQANDFFALFFISLSLSPIIFVALQTETARIR